MVAMSTAPGSVSRRCFGGMSGLLCLGLLFATLVGCGHNAEESADKQAAAVEQPLDPRCVLPRKETIESGAYTPLSRPLFVHVNRKSLERPEVAAFLHYYLNEGQELVPEVGYIAMGDELLAKTRSQLSEAVAPSEAKVKLSGSIRIDGSSTVYPITQAVAELFMELHPDVRITVALSGTGGGFKKFSLGETDINDSSRPITGKEIERCRQEKVDWLELPVAIDGLTVIVSPQNDWCNCLSVEQLKALWEPDSKIRKWSDLNPQWPAEEIRLYGADADSGTFDYFTEAIVGQARSSRTDYTASADDNVLVVGVAGDRYSLGYFGYAYYTENQDKLKAVGIIPVETKAEQ
jgi:phosphate binding protein